LVTSQSSRNLLNKAKGPMSSLVKVNANSTRTFPCCLRTVTYRYQGHPIVRVRKGTCANVSGPSPDNAVTGHLPY
jgi:hypothetical protein